MVLFPLHVLQKVVLRRTLTTGQGLLAKLAIIYGVAIRLVIWIMYVFRDFENCLMKGVPLEFNFPNKFASPPSFTAVGNLSQMSLYIHTCTKSTSSLKRFLFISIYRLSIVPVRCCWRIPN